MQPTQFTWYTPSIMISGRMTNLVTLYLISSFCFRIDEVNMHLSVVNHTRKETKLTKQLWVKHISINKLTQTSSKYTANNLKNLHWHLQNED